MRVVERIATALALIVWGAVMLFLMAAGSRSEARLIFAMVMCSLLIVGAMAGFRPSAQAIAEDDRAPCPFCAEGIKLEASVCPHCRSDLAKSVGERLRPR
jgi:hypothetical protein